MLHNVKLFNVVKILFEKMFQLKKTSEKRFQFHVQIALYEKKSKKNML